MEKLLNIECNNSKDDRSIYHTSSGELGVERSNPLGFVCLIRDKQHGCSVLHKIHKEEIVLIVPYLI